MQANIVRATADGVELPDDALDDLPRFDVESDSGRRYSVRRAADLERDLTVWRVADVTGEPVGRVEHRAPGVFAAMSPYRFFRDGASVSSGFQHTLWNAVQSLLE